ncbi:MAG: DUF4159 domain-containing protein [Acidobacteriota bacterium]
MKARGVALLALTLVVLGGAGAGAQNFMRRTRAPLREPTESSFDGGFNFCRGMYTSVRRMPSGGGWTTDYPDADINFSIRLSELTKTRVSRRPDGEPNHLTVRLTDDNLFNCAYLHMEDMGSAEFTEVEVVRLREYLQKGGFLWVDDFWGHAEWDYWEEQIARVLPPKQYPIVDLTPDHPLFHTQYAIKGVPQVISIRLWKPGGSTSEYGADSAEVHGRGISDEHGRLMVFMTHNTDIDDAWEREAFDPRYFLQFGPDGYALGVNVILYALSH